MKTIKAACINNINYCEFPAGINNIAEFVDYLNAHFHAFVELKFYAEKDCVAPYFISEATETQFFNVELIRLVKEEEIHILSPEEYDERLKKVIAEKCTHCINYIEDACGQDLSSHRNHVSLDGECCGFERKPDN